MFQSDLVLEVSINFFNPLFIEALMSLRQHNTSAFNERDDKEFVVMF